MRQKLFPIRLVSIDRIRDWSCFDADTGKDLAVELREDNIPDFSNWKKPRRLRVRLRRPAPRSASAGVMNP